MSARIRLKRGSTTSWANSSKDNKLSYGQPGIEIRAGKAPRLKVGNVNQDTAWASIPYICPDPEIYQDSQIGTSNNPLSNGYFNALTATEVVNIGLSEISNYSTNLDGTYGQNPLCVSTDQGTYELIFGGGKIGGLKNPSNDNDAANKKYVDDAIASSTSSSDEILLDLVDTQFDSYENGFYYYVTLDEPLTLETGVLYRVTFGGNSYIDTAYIDSDKIYLGNAQIYNNGAVNGAQPYFISKIGTTSSYQIIVYTGSTGDIDTVTIKIEKLGNNYANISGNAGSATKLATSRTIQTDLSSTNAASFNGTADITPGVTGVLPVENGGTGVDSFYEIVQIAHDASFSANNVTSYPTHPGIYRTIGTDIFQNLAQPHGNYGVLVINLAYYSMHIYIDEYSRIFYGRTGDTFGEPPKWKSIDGIVEQGTSGIWTYRKYESGIVECWGSKNYTGNVSTKWGSMYALTCTPPTYPITFTEKPVVTRDLTQNTGMSCWITGWSAGSATSMGTFAIIRPTTGVVDVDVNFHVIGKWK